MQEVIIIADDHSMIRKGIKMLLRSQLNCKNVVEVSSCNGPMNELKNNAYTHLILDVIFSDGTALEVVPAITQLYPHLHVMIFSMQLVEVYADAFRQYNVKYYVSKSWSEEKTFRAMYRFLNNEPQHPKEPNELHQKNPFTVLAPRELEILHYLLNGHTTNNIAKTLNLSSSTISTLKKRIFEKTETTTVTQLLELALLYNIGF